VTIPSLTTRRVTTFEQSQKDTFGASVRQLPRRGTNPLPRSESPMHRICLPLMLLCAALLLAAAGAQGASSDVVVSQVYAGGGNSAASYTNDYVELLNRGSSTVDLSSWSVQYATAAGTTWQPTPLTGSLQPGHFYLVQLASSAAVGSPLPAPDATGT